MKNKENNKKINIAIVDMNKSIIEELKKAIKEGKKIPKMEITQVKKDEYEER